MFQGDRRGDTICAVSSPHGVGGVSLIRVSGPQALSIVNSCLHKGFQNAVSHRVFLDFFLDREKQKVDQVLVTYFAEGKSFTGEEVIEISCHGSPFICQSILNTLGELGARPADRGEFSFRSFMNGKMDLTQTEGVLDLIQSQSMASQRLALRQLEGEFSKAISAIEDQVLWSVANLEAGIDFSTEGLDLQNTDEICRRLKLAQESAQALLNQYHTGRILRDGLRVSIVGQPNVGKSSLLNLIAQRDRAIVSDIAGTTRDTIETDVVFEGVKFTFVDTAGIHKQDTDVIEQIGIEKAKKEMSSADVVVFVWDCRLGLNHLDLELLKSLKSSELVLIGNKVDLVPSPRDLELEREKVARALGAAHQEALFMSTKAGSSRDLVLKKILSTAGVHLGSQEALLANSRHFALLSRANEAIGNSIDELVMGQSAEFVAISLKEGLLALQEIQGKYFDDQILDRVFKEFCIGK